ncbi:MAG: type II secretion system F family protein [Planctomycetes bacterium]|nr:type II secretion system F family protein [Planctomycetota bacterium]
MGSLTLIYIAIPVSIFAALWAIWSINRGVVAAGQSVFEENESATSSPMFKMIAPYITVLRELAKPFLLEEVGGRRKKPGTNLISIGIDVFSKSVYRWIITADYPLNITTPDFFGMIMFATILALGFGGFLYYQVGAWWVTPLPMLWALYPIFWLKEKVNRRQKECKRTLPYALDLICLAVEAGLDFNAALPRIMPKLGNNALAVEFKRMMNEIRMGKPRRESLREVAFRMNVSDLTTVVSAIVQADELGTSLGPILRIQADMIRTRRFQRAEKLAMEAPVKMLFPLLAFIFPTVFLMIFAPIGIKYILQRDDGGGVKNVNVGGIR